MGTYRRNINNNQILERTTSLIGSGYTHHTSLHNNNDTNNNFCRNFKRVNSVNSKGYTLRSYLFSQIPKKYKNREDIKIHRENEDDDDAPLLALFSSGLGFIIGTTLIFLHMILEQISKHFAKTKVKEYNREGYAPLYGPEQFLVRFCSARDQDCWNNPVYSTPGTTFRLKEVTYNRTTFDVKFLDNYKTCINLGSYNYLGLAQCSGKAIDETENSILEYGIASCSTRRELGCQKIIKEVEETMSRFLEVEDCIVFGMGFATNSGNIPSIVGAEDLVLSDSKNHASIILGLKLSKATILVFKHNDMKSLEENLEYGHINGHPVTKLPFKKIFIFVEGIYSMDATIPALPAIIQLKKKYKAYLFMDEAHSIGAMGKRGRGIVDYYNCNPSDIDVLMGTFTKSFGSAGGYIAGPKKLIDFLRVNSNANCYATGMAPAVAQQILSQTNIIMGPEGELRLKALVRNTRYFRKHLERIGVKILGPEDSPVVPQMVYMTCKLSLLIRYLRNKKQIGVVGVNYPVVPLMRTRIRYCLSAGHTKEQLDIAIDAIDEISEQLGIKYCKKKYMDKTQIAY